MGRVIMSGIVPALKAPVTYKANFAENTWVQIIDACQKNKVPETWVVGSQKTMTINGVDYPIDIIGKNHDTYSDGSVTAPLTFQLHDCYATPYQMNSSNTNSGGWTDCAMRTTYLPAILALMPSEVQAAIREVNKLTWERDDSGTIGTTVDKLFLLSEREILGGYAYSLAGEGAQYAYYQAGNTRVKNANGSAGNWWARSPTDRNVKQFCYIGSDGTNYIMNASNLCYAAFGFCF